MLSVPGIKDTIELEFRTIRVGTLRTFPIKKPAAIILSNKEAKTSEPVVLNEKGIKFALQLSQDGSSEGIVIKISARRILSVEAFMQRGCPVLWVTPDSVCAERIRTRCNITNRNGPYLDPDSEAVAERQIAIIPNQDPLPFAIGHSILRIFHKIASNNGVGKEAFFTQITHKENNDKLVQCTVYMDNVENHRLGMVTPRRSLVSDLKKNSTFLKKSGSKQRVIVSDSSDDFSDYEQEESEVLTDDGDDTEFRLKLKPTDAAPARNIETRRANKKIFASNREKEAEKAKQTGKEKVTSSEPERNVELPSPQEPQKKVHRARKSIPNRHRVVSIESQLRNRVEEQSMPKETSMRKEPDSSTSLTKRKHSDESDGSDFGRPSGSELSSSDAMANKKKRPKDPFLWTGRKKKKVANSSGSASPVPDQFEHAAQSTTTRPSTPNNLSKDEQTVSMRPSKPLDSKTQSVYLRMKTLRQDTDNLLALTPLCTCVIKAPHELNLQTGKGEAIKCMALESIEGRLYGCNSSCTHSDMLRPSSNFPPMGLCAEHRERMVRHECCPGCGTFCTAGHFLVCIKNNECPHRFHRDCMILMARSSDCPHCGGDLAEVKEVNLTPGQDGDLTWILAGHKPDKVRRKQYLESRGKSARMGHRPAVSISPDRIPGITQELPTGVVINTSTIPIQLDREPLEDALTKLDSDAMKKVRFQSKLFEQHVKAGDLFKMLQMLSNGFVRREHQLDLDTALLTAIPDSPISVTHVLVQAGADVNSTYEDGDTPLIRATAERNKELLYYLLVHGADVKIKDEEGMTCLHHAAKDGFIEGCHLLLTYGKAKINCLDNGGWTPMIWAAENKQATIAKYLMHYGADVNVVDKEGNISLHWAALAGNVDVLWLCLRNNVNVNHTNTHGDTALHIASRENHYDCLTMLLAKGADPTIMNKEGDSPLCLAERGSLSLVALSVNDHMRKKGLIDGTHLPFHRERVLSEDLSRGYDKVPIMCVNSVDDAPCPTDPPSGFHYVTENVHSSFDTRINHVTANIQSCFCIDGCTTSSCRCSVISEGCWYAEDGTLLPNFDITEPPLVFECHKMCKCSTSCRNRVVQRGIKYRLQVYRTIGMGWGLRTLEPIPRGAFVCDYVGELISDAEADGREDDSYLFDLENKDSDMFCVDARSYGNVSRFINHLCEPNLVPIRVFVDHHDIRFPKLAYFASRDISTGEELGFDYGDRFWDVKCRQFTCQCGSINCKYSEEAYQRKAAMEAEAKTNPSEGEETHSNGRQENDH